MELCKNMTNIRYELMSMMKSGNWYVIFGIKNSLATGPITSQYPTRPEVKKHSPSGTVFKLSYRYWLIEAGCLGGGWRWWWTVLIARSTPEDLRYSRSVAWKPRAPLCWKPWRMLRLLLKTSPTAPFIENLDRSLVCWRRSSNRLCGVANSLEQRQQHNWLLMVSWLRLLHIISIKGGIEITAKNWPAEKHSKVQTLFPSRTSCASKKLGNGCKPISRVWCSKRLLTRSQQWRG